MLPPSMMIFLDYLSTFGSLTWYAKSWYRVLLMFTVPPNFSNKMNKLAQQTVILLHRGTVKNSIFSTEQTPYLHFSKMLMPPFH